jgi:hypothetical protein
MRNTPLHVNNGHLKFKNEPVRGEMITLAGEMFYKISHYDKMPPFFMSIVSDSDHWMFIWSSGALAAGRKNADNALFPYYTDDKILDSTGITGSKTILIAGMKGKRFLWEPFSDQYAGLYTIERNCYKSIYGNKLIFEEINFDLNLCFTYAWMSSEKFGFIKKSRLLNLGDSAISVDLLDGIQNILASGISQRFQLEYSTLADAYKKNELEPDTGLGIYSLSSIPTDKAEPSESLKATVVWQAGLRADATLLSSRQLGCFRQGQPVVQETDVRAARGAYLIHTILNLASAELKAWYTAADINIDSAGVVNIIRCLKENRNLARDIEEDIARGTDNLIRTVANADGLQKSAEPLSTSRHFSNVLFNIMRGGIFNDDYRIKTGDFIRFLNVASRHACDGHRQFFNALPDTLDYPDLIGRVTALQDASLEKLCYEYLPLTFSRRHGDPSRPWNRFSIDIKDDTGGRNLNYQGNWRDIFQNWEALALSFPLFIEGMITKFVNASTADGYNPYRVERDGFEWEVIDPDDAWSYIGYWGDHQIIYLLKLLELSRRFHPGRLKNFLTRDIFAYANVPYRIKSYHEILADPHHTVDFDVTLDEEIKKRAAAMGTDGKFILTGNHSVFHVNLTEKLIVPMLVKLSNFIPGAGIWMNTQRPEWNDANNALVGYGVSMVTICYLRRHLAFCSDLFADLDEDVLFSVEVADFFNTIHRILRENHALLAGDISDTDRKMLLDRLGLAGSDYRAVIYKQGFSCKKKVIRMSALRAFCRESLKYIDHTIRANRRDDGLYHTYNLMKVVGGNKITIRTLYEMLEGQVAVLSSGVLKPEEALKVLTALRESRIYREDQCTYLLYPDRDLPRFSQKNHIPPDDCLNSRLIQLLVKQGDERIVVTDRESGIHFNGMFRNAGMLKQALQKLDMVEPDLDLAKEKELILNIYEKLFDHQSFTGRSGTFFKYEGLGCTYWHMISKLLLAVQECYYQAVWARAPKTVLSKLASHYYEIRNGIGGSKSPDLYGAFPTDPYSHTPAHAGVQQPGMTGQVKEDIISRFGELGIVIREGRIAFHPALLRREEFLSEAGVFTYIDVHGHECSIELQSGSLAFTLVQVPVVYHRSDKEKVIVYRNTDHDDSIDGLVLNEEISRSVFSRTGEIRRIDVYLP